MFTAFLFSVLMGAKIEIAYDCKLTRKAYYFDLVMENDAVTRINSCYSIKSNHSRLMVLTPIKTEKCEKLLRYCIEYCKEGI